MELILVLIFHFPNFMTSTSASFQRTVLVDKLFWGGGDLSGILFH